MKADPSITVTYKDKKILVSDLPDEIKYEVTTWDRLAQDRIDAYFELEKTELAWQAKKSQIGALIEAWERGLNKEDEAKANEIDTNE